MDSEKADPLFSLCSRYVKAFDRVKRENCLKNYKTKIFPAYYERV
jgi:hypothetical protein